MQVLLAFAALTVLFAVLISRLLVLGGLIAPVAAALIFSRLRRSWPWAAGAVALAVQAALLATTLPVMTKTTWYMPAESRNLKQFINWSRVHLGEGCVIACDYVNSSAILAHTAHSVVLQPKYETRSSRDRIERFLTAFYHGSPEELHVLLEKWECRYLLVDVYAMSALRYQAGLPVWAMPAPGTAALFFLSSWEERYQAVPGFRLIYVNEDKPPTWRLYRLE